MSSQRKTAPLRWFGAFAGLAVITFAYARLLHVNPTTIALTYLLFILFLSTRWGLVYAVAGSFVAAGCYNFFFLPPLHTFTVADPQNVVALLVLLITAVVASRMSEQIRRESRQANVRQSELEVLYTLSRAFLQTDELSVLTNAVPNAVLVACRARSVVFYLLQDDSVFRAGVDLPPAPDMQTLRLLADRSRACWNAETQEAVIPLRTGAGPRGALILSGIAYSQPTLEAVGGLVSVSLDRAQAMDEATRAEAAEESERLRTMMMDSITHEFRSPLTAIKVAVSTLRTADLTIANASEFLAIIEEETDRLDHLVAQSVEMSRLDTLEVTMTFSAQNMRLLIEQAMHGSTQALAKHPVEVNVPQDLPEVQVDAEWLVKLLANLLENASKYSKAGEPICITAAVQGGRVHCSVADRGVGIDPVEQRLIFDKFYRAKQRMADVAGTGMGLAICRAIAQAHGGAIEVTSQPGKGSTFTFTVPAA